MHIKNIHQNKIFININIIISFIFLAIFCFILLIHKHCLFSGTDLLFHLKRIMEIKASFIHGILPNFSFNQFHGSSVMILYPYLNLLPILLLSVFIKSNILLVYSWLSFNVFLSLIISFYSSKSFSKSVLTSYVFAIIYSLSNIFMSYIYYDSDYGVVTVIAVLPLIVFGFLHILNNDSVIELSTGMILIVFSHVLSIFIIIGFLIIWMLINYSNISHIIIRNIFKCGLIVLLITSVEWLPAMYFSLYNLHSIESLSFSYLKGTKFTSLLSGSLFTNISYGLSMLAIIGLVLSILFYKRLTKYMRQMLWISILFIFICSTLFPWQLFHNNLFKPIKVFQFSWRFYIIPQILLCYIFSKIITQCITYKKLGKTLAIISILIVIISQFCYQYRILNINSNVPIITSSFIRKHKNHGNSLFDVKYNNQFPKAEYGFSNSSQMKNLYNIDGNGFKYFNDYYPKENNSIIKDVNNNLIKDNNGNDVPLLYNGFNTFTFYNNDNSKRALIPIFKYRSEKLRIYLNHKLIPVHSKNKLIYLFNIRKGKNIIHIKFISNMIIKYISLLMFLVGLLWYIFALKTLRKHKRISIQSRVNYEK